MNKVIASYPNFFFQIVVPECATLDDLDALNKGTYVPKTQSSN